MGPRGCCEVIDRLAAEVQRLRELAAAMETDRDRWRGLFRQLVRLSTAEASREAARGAGSAIMSFLLRFAPLVPPS